MSAITINPAKLLPRLRAPKLAEIQQKLVETDYKAIKFAEGVITAEEFEPIKTYRAALRSAYNAIEAATSAEEIEKIVIPSE